MCGEDPGDVGVEISGDGTAITTGIGITPGDQRAIGFDSSESTFCGEELGDTTGELSRDSAAIATTIGITPCDDGAVVFEDSEGFGVAELMTAAARADDINRRTVDEHIAGLRGGGA